MTVSITSTTYCMCGDDMTATSSSFKAVDDLHAAFETQHSGEGHGLFPTAAEALKARKAVAP